MKLLFVNAAYREGSRTARLAASIIEGLKPGYDELECVNLAYDAPAPLDGVRLAEYNIAVENGCFDSPMFDAAKQFVEADEIVVAAPFWNFTLPAALHSYLELVCTQGISFDITTEGRYYGKCRAKRLTFVTTSGGYIPEHNFAFDYIAELCSRFWEIKNVRCIKAEGLDVRGNDVEAILENALK